MTSNFSTLVNSLLTSFIKGYRVKSSADRRQKLSSIPVHFENFKLHDQRLVVVCGGKYRVINSRPLFNLSVMKHLFSEIID